MCPLAIAHGDPLAEDERPASLAHALRSSVEKFPDGGFVFFGAGGDVSRQSYRSVWEEAKRILHGLHLQGLGPGDKVVLYFATCRNFIPALWAAFLGGIVAVPLMLNERSRHDRQKAPELFPYLKKILGGSFILTDAPVVQLETVGLHPRDALRYETLDDGTPAKSFFGDDEDHQPRLLILTSGTTALPNLTGLSAGAVVSRWWAPLPAADDAATFLSWAPFDHVMGLSIASPNVPNKAYLPTESFIRQPTLWLDAADRLGATHGTMTNFGMTLLERQVASLPDDSWNLSSIRKIGVGAEAISPRVCRRFVKTLQRFGLRRDAVVLGYGLSECGPVVGGDHHFEFDHSTDSDPFLLLDGPTRGHSVRIVSESGTLVQEDEVGAVQVRGPSMTLGYIGNEEASRSLFSQDGWIRTGDIGLLRNGRLMITGREKETIHINAKKYACVEIETIAQSISGVETAFAVGHRIDATDPHERFVLFFIAPSVPQSELASLKQELSATIAAKFGLAPAYLVQIAADEVPRTPSGKVQRFQLAARLEAGRFAKAEPPRTAGKRRLPSTPIERSIAKTWADLLGFDDFGVDDDFFTLGGDSLQAIGLTLELESKFREDHSCRGVARENDDFTPGAFHRARHFAEIRTI